MAQYVYQRGENQKYGGVIGNESESQQRHGSKQ